MGLRNRLSMVYIPTYPWVYAPVCLWVYAPVYQQVYAPVFLWAYSPRNLFQLYAHLLIGLRTFSDRAGFSSFA